MCGIAALWGRADDAAIRQFIAKQRHRGPDGEGIRRTASRDGVLGHCRLAIIDPAAGAQPLVAEGGTSALVANGMIYNDLALRGENGEDAYKTHSDSESILHSIAREGPEAVAKLDGMFAFVMEHAGRLIAARDPIGIKPLYMARQEGAVAFASEIKAFDGFAADIEEFPAGHVFDDRAGLRPYYTVPDRGPDNWRLDDALVALRDTLERAVVKRLRSDVPFGALLSGGLDSSIIAALARRHVEDLQTFAVGLAGSADLIAARRVAEYLGTRHHEMVITPDQVRAALPDILYHLESFDKDLVRSAVPCYFVSRFAAQRVKVVLTGEGADELFAGYGYYRDYEDPDALHAELCRSIESMHDINLQRVDRMTMAHGLEGRVPFLDTEMVALGLSLPTDWKLQPVKGRRVEKWLLRKAFEDLLPSEIVWRDKLQFDQGSGMADLLETEMGRGDGPRAEQDRYRALLARRFETPERVLGLVSHWEQRPAA
jgi:asparagine synthase (glutamine-hydrolysing)